MESEFETYFKKIYEQRWPRLFQALKQEESQICFSPFSKELNQFVLSPEQFSYVNKEDSLKRSENGHLENYILDPASLAPVLNLVVASEDQVLDLCAAPGGKSLGILSALGSGGFLLSNDSSRPRFERLKKVLSQYTPKEHPAGKKVVNKDGTRFGFYYKNHFNKILVDVPCSSERHHISQSRTAEWTLKRAKFLSIKQYTLLCAALLCAQPGATLIYSTCSINPVENDEVIRKFLKKKRLQVKLGEITQSFPGAENTEFGQMILPDQMGYGPIYFSRLIVND